MNKIFTAATPHYICSLANNSKQQIKQKPRMILVLRGDINSTTHNHSNIILAVQTNQTTGGRALHLASAVFPEGHHKAVTPQHGLWNIIAKTKIGLHVLLTQLIHCTVSYLKMVEKLDQFGVEAPVLPGLLPSAKSNQLLKFTQVCGTDIPLWLLKELELTALSSELTIELCEDLDINQVPGVHFYTLNDYAATSNILASLSTDYDMLDPELPEFDEDIILGWLFETFFCSELEVPVFQPEEALLSIDDLLMFDGEPK